MSVRNKMLKGFVWFLYQIWVYIQVFVISVVLTSPLMAILFVVTDSLVKINFIVGKAFVLWLIISSVIALIMFIRICVINTKTIKAIKKEKEELLKS